MSATEPPPHLRLRTRLLLVLMAVAALLLATAPSWLPEAGPLLARLQALQAWQLACVLAGLVIAQACRAERVHAEWQSRAGVSWWECLRVVSLHYGLLNVLPMRAGEAGFAWLLWRRWQVPLSRATLSLVAWRMQDVCILVGYALLLWLPVALPWRLAALLAWALGLMALLRQRPRLSAWLLARRGDRWSDRLARQIGPALAPAATQRSGWVCGSATWGAKLITAAALLCWLAELPAGVAIGAALAGEWGAALPLQPAAGFGTYEAAVWAGVAALQPAGSAASATTVLLAALAAHLLTAGFAIVLGALFWLGTLVAPHASRPSA